MMPGLQKYTFAPWQTWYTLRIGCSNIISRDTLRPFHLFWWLRIVVPLSVVPSPVDCTAEQIAVQLVVMTSPMGCTEEELTAADILEKKHDK
jgi:hypothetical protein